MMAQPQAHSDTATAEAQAQAHSQAHSQAKPQAPRQVQAAGKKQAIDR